MPASGGAFQPEPISLPTVDNNIPLPLEAGQPASLQTQGQQQVQQSQKPVSGYMGKGGQALNVVDNFLKGWMAGKNIQEQKAIQQRSNDIKAHTVTAQTMYTSAQAAADEARRLQESGAAADQVEAANKKAKDTYAAYANEQQQLAAAYAKHLGVGGEPQKGVKNKVKAGVERAFMPQMAAMLAPEAVKAIGQPRPLKVPTEEERLGIDEKKASIEASKAKADEARAGAAQWRSQTDTAKAAETGKARALDLGKEAAKGPLTPEKQAELDRLDMQYFNVSPTQRTLNSITTKIGNKQPLTEDEHAMAVQQQILPDTTPTPQQSSDGFLHWVTPPTSANPHGTDIKTNFRVTNSLQNDQVEREYNQLSKAWTDSHNGQPPDQSTRGALRTQAIEGTERSWQRYDAQKKNWEEQVGKQERIIDDQQKQVSVRDRNHKPMTAEQIRQKAEEMVGSRPQPPGSATSSGRVNDIFNDIFSPTPKPTRVQNP
jgi:hypothetical protein